MDDIRKELLLGMGFSEKAVLILEKELNMGAMEEASVTVQHQGTCGDILILHLKIEDAVIENASYEYVGCAGLQACASALTEMIKGQTLDKAYAVEIEDIISYLGGIPPQKYECAEISRDTLRKAITNWQHSNENIDLK
jgi:NifU-like protein involved in Fe-S cluster formation